MAKGASAKIEVAKKLQEAFGADYIGEVDKKWYVWADDGGEKVQIAIAMTCPKTPVETSVVPTPSAAVGESNGGFDWDAPVAPVAAEPAVITEDEKANIAKLMEQLNL